MGEKEVNNRDLMVFAHPDDEVAVIGCLADHCNTRNQRMVWVTNGDGNTESDRTVESERALQHFGIESGLSFWNFSQKEIYQKILAREYGFIGSIEARLTEAIEQFDPACVYTCAFEGGHIMHDILNYLVHKIARKRGHTFAGIEFPQYHIETYQEEDEVVYARFDTQTLIECLIGNAWAFEVSEASLAKKRACHTLYQSQQRFIDRAFAQAGEETIRFEVFREIPFDRDYLIKPKQKIFYEARGIERGYQEQITFNHFSEIVEKQ